MFLSLTAAALVARAWLAVSRPLWHDELFTLWAARMSPRALAAALRHDSGPPLFYVFEKPFVALAEKIRWDEFARALPFAAVALLLVAACHLPDRAARIWFGALVACSPFLLLYSAEARAYAPLAALDLAVFILLFLGRPTGARLAAGALAAAAALWTHYLAIFFLAAAGLLLLVTRRYRSAAAVAAGGIFFLPWVPLLIAQPREATAWIHESVGRSALFFLSGLGGGARVPLPVGVPLPETLFLASAAVGLWLAAALARASRRDSGISDAALLCVGTLALILVASVVRPAAVAGRTEMAILPIWLWALARTAAGDSRSRIPVAAALVAGLVTCGATLATPRGEPSTTIVGRLLANEALGSDRVVASTAYYLPLRLAKDRGELRAELSAFPTELATHPGWFVPGPPPEGSIERLVAELRGESPRARVFIVTHPLWAGAELRDALASAGAVRELVRRPDAVLLVWSLRVPARDREQREPEPRR